MKNYAIKFITTTKRHSAYFCHSKLPKHEKHSLRLHIKKFYQSHNQCGNLFIINFFSFLKSDPSCSLINIGLNQIPKLVTSQKIKKNTQVSFLILNSNSLASTHQWSSGRIVPCHGTDPGSIPGWCIFFHFYFWEKLNNSIINCILFFLVEIDDLPKFSTSFFERIKQQYY